ncbi:unnamed protein product [Heligmosomoides polygyrus]|uniref:FHA domain-containing protein n=1 Tax=Heligmosomoides polygyrus TaxID=6339 RepID=A0A183FWQ0_HELPZ|nr:unnamed protein product [Heligmosomoides polygyrus]
MKKTEYLAMDVNEHGSIKINGTELSRVTSFKYLGSTVTSDGSLKLEVNARPVTQEIESHLSVMETTMLLWSAGVTRFDRVRNETIRQRFVVAPMAEKLREAHLQWYGHLLRTNDDTVRKIGLNLEVPEKRPRGRPKQRWLNKLRLDLNIAGVHLDQAFDRRIGVTPPEERTPLPSRTDPNENDEAPLQLIHVSQRDNSLDIPSL